VSPNAGKKATHSVSRSDDVSIWIVNTRDSHAGAAEGGISELWNDIRRAFAEFLTVPTLVIVAFLLMAAGSYMVDRTEITAFQTMRGILKTRVFADSRATSELLGTIAGGIITVTSIIISLLLVALQQSAASLTHQVFDQFLRRRTNQFYFGFFIGLSLFALLTLATVTESFNPVFGASLAFLLTMAGLYILILLLYTTINQMRPAVIIEAIHAHTLAARQSQIPLILKTQRSPRAGGLICRPVKAHRHGFVTHINVDAAGAAAKDLGMDVEIVLRVSIGCYVAFQDVIAEVRMEAQKETASLEKSVQDAVHFENQRDIGGDPAYGIEQMEMIAWTSISTAKSDPAPGLLIIRNLRDVLAHWAAEDNASRQEETLPIVYTDNVFSRLMEAFETLAVVASESMQHQNFAEVLRTFAIMFDRLSPDQQVRAEDIILRIISALGDHVLTAELEATLSELVLTLDKSARITTAAAVQAAQNRLKLSVGKLHSRSTRSQAK
jgi:uncharacterized membrane protein